MPSSPLIPAAICSALPSVGAWTEYFRSAEIPILRETADALEVLRADQDRVDANSLGELISNDPLMTLKVLAYASQHRSARVVTDTETVTAALVMMGISPFFHAFGPQLTIESLLGTEPEALAGLQTLLKRVHRGANLALAFAVHRMDPDAAVIHGVTLLHEFAEMLLWCYAPSLALKICAAQTAELHSGRTLLSAPC
jgi:HD-like signal output (HDOD) protein